MTVRKRWIPFAGAAAASILVASLATPTSAPAADKADGGLAEKLRAAVAAQNWQDILDTAPPGTASARSLAADPNKGYELDPRRAATQKSKRAAKADPKPIHQMPNVDLSVIELGPGGKPKAAATVLVSKDYPNGKVVPLDKNMRTDQVRWGKWDDAQWDAGEQGAPVLPGTDDRPIKYMQPYPASVMKVMVGYGLLKLVDAGKLSLDEKYTYKPVGTPNSLCGKGGQTKSVRQYFDEMTTVSNNMSTCALVKLLHDKKAVDATNQAFVDLGLELLQLKGTDPNTGGKWGGNSMGAMDTAKLLLLVSGAPGTLWTDPAGKPVTKDKLSAKSRKFFMKELGEQGLNQVLTTTNWCGRDYPAAGLIQKVHPRWINPLDGKMTVDGRVYGQDVRPCNAKAEVTFAHKTGFVDTSGNDAGIVNSLPGKPKRDYVVVVNSNLGNRYVDKNRPADPPGIYPVAYSEKYGKLGLAIDKILTAAS